MIPLYADDLVTLHHGDCLEVLRGLPDCSVDAVVTDPPYGLSNTKPTQVADVLAAWVTGDTEAVPATKGGFMGKDWDSFVPPPAVWAECLRVLKPGGHMAVFAGARTQDLMGLSIRLAGFEVRDTLGWIYGCLSEDTEVLINGEWVQYHKAKVGDLALCCNKEHDTYEWQPIEDTHKYEYGDTAYRIHSNNTDQIVSRNHRVLVERGGAYEFEYAENLARERQIRVPVLEDLPALLDDLSVEPVPVRVEPGSQAVRGARYTVADLAEIEPVHYEGIVWCLTVPTGAFVARRNGKVFVTGNSGFPKSMDVSKAIDKGQALTKGRAYEFTEWMRSTGLTARQIDEATGTNMGNHYTTHHTQPAIATADLFDKLRPLLPEVPERIERLVAERTGIEWTDYIKREVVGKNRWTNSANHFVPGEDHTARVHTDITAPATSEAARWDGWGTALKPAIEPIILARKPLEGTVAANVLAHGVGGLNIDACRVPTDKPIPSHHGTSGASGVTMGKYRDYVPGSATAASAGNVQTAGRFPTNVLLDEHAAKEMDRQSGVLKSGANPTRRTSDKFRNAYGDFKGHEECTPARGADSGGASRFFPVFKYQAKAPKKERPVIEREDGTKIQHPTVKPLSLMSWIVTLITPPGGTVLDPFAGSGTTLQAARDKGFRAIGVEQDADYIQLIETRLETAAADGVLF